MTDKWKRLLGKALVFLLVFAELSAGVPSALADDSEWNNLTSGEVLQTKIEDVLQGRSGDITIGYYYPRGELEWYYNADVWMYSASLYKVPNCMLLEEKENAGEITQDTDIYGYTVAQQEYAAIVSSDNDRGHDIVRYNGGDEYSDKCSDRFIKYTDLPETYFTEEKFTGDSYYTARFYNKILMYLYNHSGEYPHVLDCMKQTQPGHYLNKQSIGDYEVAQKYGSYEKKADGPVFHAAGIIYTPNPIVVTIMTRSAGYDEQLFGDIADVLIEYTQILDDTEIPPKEMVTSEETATPEPTAVPAGAENTPVPEAEPSAEPSPEPAALQDEPEQEEKSGVSALVWIVPVVVVAGVAVFLLLRKKKKPQKEERYIPKH